MARILSIATSEQIARNHTTTKPTGITLAAQYIGLGGESLSVTRILSNNFPVVVKLTINIVLTSCYCFSGV